MSRSGTTEGDRLLADGVFARYEADRFQLCAYTLAHLAHHVAASARADPARPLVRQRQLAEFVLDRVVLEERLEDAFGTDPNLRLALQTVEEKPPAGSASLATRLALGLEAFRRERLEGSRIPRPPARDRSPR